MSVWVTEEVLRCALRFCSRRSPWTQRGLPVATSLKDTSVLSQSAHVWATRQTHTCRDMSLVRSVRFYSQVNSHSGNSIEAEHLSDFSLPDETSPAGTSSGRGHTPSPFLDHLPHCGSPSDVLDLAGKHAPTVGQISSCLNHMWTTTKKMSDEQLRCERQLMSEHPAFDTLLQRAMNSVGSMRHESITYSLLSMVNLGVPQKSRVVQTFLRVCQEKLNDFDEKNLSILASCLEHMENSPNVSALKEGMRLVVEARLPGIKKVLALQTLMRLIGKDAPLTLKRKLEQKALSMTDQFTIPNSQHMISTMAKMNFYSKPLLSVCSKKIIENLHLYPFSRLLAVLLSCRELHYRDLELLTGISDHVTSTFDIWTNKQVLLFLSAYHNLNFCPLALLGVFTERVMACPDALTLKDLLCVLKVYSSLNYDLQHHRQQFLDSLTPVLESYLPNISGIKLLKAVFYLSVLGHFPSAPLQQLLQPSTMEQFQSTRTSSLPTQTRMFQTLDLCLRLDRPPLPCSLAVPPWALGDHSPIGPPVNQLLSQGLRGMLGDQAETMLQEMVMEENVYSIDAVITKPLPKQTSGAEASGCEGEEPSPAESSQRMAVVFTPTSGFCYGTSNPRGHLALKIRHLKILGYNPVLVSEQELHAVPAETRTEFLRALVFPEHHRSDTQLEMDRNTTLKTDY